MSFFFSLFCAKFCSSVFVLKLQQGAFSQGIITYWCGAKKKCIYLILTLIKAWMVVLVPGVEPPSVWVTDHNPISLFFNRTICVFFWASFRPPRARQHHECGVQKTTWWLLLKAQGWNPFFFFSQCFNVGNFTHCSTDEDVCFLTLFLPVFLRTLQYLRCICIYWPYKSELLVWLEYWKKKQKKTHQIFLYEPPCCLTFTGISAG